MENDNLKLMVALHNSSESNDLQIRLDQQFQGSLTSDSDDASDGVVNALDALQAYTTSPSGMHELVGITQESYEPYEPYHNIHQSSNTVGKLITAQSLSQRDAYGPQPSYEDGDDEYEYQEMSDGGGARRQSKSTSFPPNIRMHTNTSQLSMCSPSNNVSMDLAIILDESQQDINNANMMDIQVSRMSSQQVSPSITPAPPCDFDNDITIKISGEQYDDGHISTADKNIETYTDQDWEKMPLIGNNSDSVRRRECQLLQTEKNDSLFCFCVFSLFVRDVFSKPEL